MHATFSNITLNTALPVCLLPSEIQTLKFPNNLNIVETLENQVVSTIKKGDNLFSLVTSDMALKKQLCSITVKRFQIFPNNIQADHFFQFPLFNAFRKMTLQLYTTESAATYGTVQAIASNQH